MPAVEDLEFSCTYTLDGCSVTATAQIENSQCTPPTMPGGFTADLAAICLGDSTILRLSSGVRNQGEWVLYAGGCGDGTPIARSHENLIGNVTFTVKPTQTTEYFIRGEGCGTNTSCQQLTITVNPLPNVIQGENEVCVGATATVINLTPGGTWEVGVSGHLAVDDPAVGTVRGVMAGTGTIYYVLPTGCRREGQITVKETPAAIVGDTNLCVGSTRIFTSATPDGIWTSSASLVASLTSHTSGELTANTIGTTELRYTHSLTGCDIMKTVRVWQQPISTTGDRSVCRGESIQLTNNTVPTGDDVGVWSIQSGGSAATISATGLLTANSGTSSATVIVQYTLGHCSDTFRVDVRQLPNPITGPTTLCEEQVQTYTNTGTSGTWSSSNTAIATVNATSGELTAVSAGTFDLIFTSPYGCTTQLAITVNPLPAPIDGPNAVGVGGTITLSTTSTAGVWSSLNPTIASVGASNGVVTGLSQGTAEIRYMYPTTGCYRIHEVTVSSCDVITLTSAAGTNIQNNICNGSPMTSIIYELSNGVATTTQIAWYRDDGTPMISPPMPAGISYNGTTHTISGSPTAVGTFEYVITSTDHGPGCDPVTASGEITVHPPVLAGTIAASHSICDGDDPEAFTSTAAGSGGSPTSEYRWQFSNNQTDWFDRSGSNSVTFDDATTLNVVDGNPTPYYYRRAFINSCSTAYSNILTVTVNPAPAIPTADVTPNSACSGDPNGIIEITAPTGSGYTYAIAGSDGVRSAFQTSPIFNGRSSSAYTVTVRNIHGCESTQSFTVGSSSGAPVITGFNVTPNDSICSSALATTTVTLTPQFDKDGGVTYSYLWNTGDGTSTIGTAETLTRIGGTISETTTYQVTVTNTTNGCDAKGSTIIHVIDPITISGITVSKDTICINQTAPTITVTPSTLTGVTYQWQSSTTGIGGYTNIADNATAQIYTVPNAAVSDLWYRCIVTTTAGICPSVTSDSVHVGVLPIPGLPTVTENPVHVCAITGTADLVATTNEAGCCIRWYDNNGLLQAQTNSGETFTTATFSAPNSVTYRAYADNGTCYSADFVEVVATMHLPHILTHASGDTNLATACINQPFSEIHYNIGGGAASASIAWTPQGTTTGQPTGMNLEVNGQDVIIKGTPTVAGTWNFEITTTPFSGNECPVLKLTGRLTVYPTPATPTANITPNSACAGGAPDGKITITAPLGTGFEYSINGGTTWQTTLEFAGLNTADYTVIAKNPEGCQSSATFSVPGSSGTPVITGISIVTNPTVNPANNLCRSVLSTTEVTLTPQFNKGTGNYTYVWSPGSATTEALVLPVNSITGTTTYTVTITNTDNLCSSNKDTTIQVTEPITASIATTTPEICVGGTAPVINLTASTSTGVSYLWQRTTSDTELETGSYQNVGGDATTQNYTVPNTPASDRWYRCTITTTDGICPPVVTNAVQVKVVAAPAQPVRDDGSITALCRNESHAFEVQAVTGVTFNWTAPANWTATTGTGTSFTTAPGTGAASGNIVVTPTNSTGCTGTPLTIFVTVNELPAIPNRTDGSPSALCRGTTHTFAVSSVSNVSFAWTAPDNNWTPETFSGLGFQTTPGTGATSGNITVTPTNTTTNCVGPALNIAITVNDIPSMPVRNDGTISALCPGIAHTFSVTTESGVGYAWTAPTGWTLTTGGPAANFSTAPGSSAVAGNITVTPSYSNGCEGPKLEFAIGIHTPPAIPVRTGTTDVIICRNLPHTFSVIQETGVTYEWIAPDANWTPYSVSTVTFSTTPGATADNGNVTVTPTSAEGCVGSPLEIPITIAAPLTFTIHPDNHDLVVPVGVDFCPDTLFVAATAGILPITFEWYFTDANNYTSNVTAFTTGVQSTQTTSKITIPNNVLGERYYHVKASNACQSNVQSNISGLREVAEDKLPASECNFISGTDNANIVTAEFATGTPTTIPARGNIAAQIWSDFVISPQCNKTSYNGGSAPTFNVDCKRNETLTTFPGDYFSWCAVMKYAHILCPAPWRVPSKQDFIHLDILLGGQGVQDSRNPSDQVISGQAYTSGSNNNNNSGTHNPRGGSWQGSRFTANASVLTVANSNYWSSTDGNTQGAYTLYYGGNLISPQPTSNKGSGFAVRCVKD
ncbi:MAG: hypothetical protein FWG79_00770 [Bacteroidales bacterium]|nr:hypothetical protein [Bacteroidales bacterium]